MNQVNETKFTEVTVEERENLQEKAETLGVMEKRKNAAIFMGGTTMAVLLLVVAGHSWPEIVKSSNHLKEIIIAETAKNARQKVRLSFLSQTVDGVLSTIPNMLRA